MKKIQKLGIVAFKPKPMVIASLERFAQWAKSKDLRVFLYEEAPSLKIKLPFKINRINKNKLADMDMILSFGGDGTLLSSARLVHSHNIPIAGISVGSLGFLTDISLDTLEDSLDQIISGKFRIVERMMLDVLVKHKNKIVWENIALNEAVVSKAGSIKLLSLSAWRGKNFISRFWLDGLIIATPTGSTAYSLSAGGPIIYPSLEAVVLTPICPHALTERPMILPADKNITIKIEEEKPPAFVTVDGKALFKLSQGDEVIISRSKEKVRLIKAGNANHFETLRNKLNWSKK